MDDQMIESLLRDFLDNGYYIVPGLLSSNEVSELRSVCESHSRIRKEAEMRASHFLSTPQLASVPFREEAIRVLEQLLGEEYTIFPNFTVRSEAYVPWHVDEGFIGKGEYLDNKDFLAVQCAVYLQDNVPKQGGAIDVIPGSHLDREVQPPETDAIGNCGGGPLALSLPVKAGDMVMWDGRIMHRSTPMGASSGQKKFGIFWSASHTYGEHISTYLRHLFSRAFVRRGGKTVILKRYAEIRTIRFPESYPADVVEIVRSQGVNIAAFDKR